MVAVGQYTGGQVARCVRVERRLPLNLPGIADVEVAFIADLRAAVADVAGAPIDRIHDRSGHERGDHVPGLTDEESIIVVLDLPVCVAEQDRRLVLDRERALKVQFDLSPALGAAEPGQFGARHIDSKPRRSGPNVEGVFAFVFGGDCPQSVIAQVSPRRFVGRGAPENAVGHDLEVAFLPGEVLDLLAGDVLGCLFSRQAGYRRESRPAGRRRRHLPDACLIELGPQHLRFRLKLLNSIKQSVVPGDAGRHGRNLTGRQLTGNQQDRDAKYSQAGHGNLKFRLKSELAEKRPNPLPPQSRKITLRPPQTGASADGLFSPLRAGESAVRESDEQHVSSSESAEAAGKVFATRSLPHYRYNRQSPRGLAPAAVARSLKSLHSRNRLHPAAEPSGFSGRSQPRQGPLQ